MSVQSGEVTDQNRNEIFSALAHEDRRIVLRTLRRLSQMTIEELAVHLIATKKDKPLVGVTPQEATQATATLHHTHLPKLADVGLIQQDAGTISITQHPVLQDPKITSIVETTSSDWTAVLSCLAETHRRIILSILSQHDEPMEKTELATAVLKQIQDERTAPLNVDTMCQKLFHVHLPKLAAADLISYDVDDGLVSYVGHPELDAEWLVADPTDTPREILSMADQTTDIWTLEGRANVTERGRALCESADEELFMMFTVDGLIERGCLRRIQDALDRDVDVYLGTQNQELRDLVRENAPGVTIWEPQLDWLNLPPKREKVGRLIMADRSEIMIGTIADTESDGVPCETAITGTGEDNPLVMLLREMLGSRLDHLDAQSADFRSEMPL